jgi:DNA-binding MarR family transcriptional regulator
LTKKGLKLIEKVILEHVKTQEEIVSVFNDEEQQLFIALLKKYLSKDTPKVKKEQ